MALISDPSAWEGLGGSQANQLLVLAESMSSMFRERPCLKEYETLKE